MKPMTADDEADLAIATQGLRMAAARSRKTKSELAETNAYRQQRAASVSFNEAFNRRREGTDMGELHPTWKEAYGD